LLERLSARLSPFNEKEPTDPVNVTLDDEEEYEIYGALLVQLQD
jgi:hypothetical protein